MLYHASVFPCRGRQAADPGSNVMASFRKIFEISKIRIRLLFFWLDMDDCSFCRQNQNLHIEATENPENTKKPRRRPTDSARALCIRDRTHRKTKYGYFQPEISRYPVPGPRNSTAPSSDICSYCKSELNCCNLYCLDT